MQHSRKYLPHWLQQAFDLSGMVQVSFPHGGLVLIDSVTSRYDCDCDSDSPLLLSDEAVEIKALPGALLSRRAQPLSYLLWTVQLKRLQAELKLHPYEFQAHVLRLNAWPCMNDLPPAALPLVARICALLAHRPTSALLIPTMLDAPAAQVYPVLEVLHVNRFVRMVGEHHAAADAACHGHPNQPGDRPLHESSLVAKIWQRLRAHPWGT